MGSFRFQCPPRRTGDVFPRFDIQRRSVMKTTLRSFIILVLAMIFVALNLIVDVLQTLIDPRIRRGAAA